LSRRLKSHHYFHHIDDLNIINFDNSFSLPKKMTIVSDDSLVMSSGQLENVYGFGYENEF
jgi:hypothetical protein